MQVMVELQDGTVHPIEELEIIGYDPLIVALHNKKDHRAVIAKVRRFFVQKGPAMSRRESCNNCMWDKVDPILPHCLDVRNKGDRLCNRFQVYQKVDPYYCGFCDRDKDPGKCWWCEQIDA